MSLNNAERTDWMQQLLAELACAEGLAIPLYPLLSSRLQGCIGPQQLFDGVKLLLERGPAELVQNEGRTCLALRTSDRMRPENLSQGDLVELSAAIAAARGCCKPKPQQDAYGKSTIPDRAQPPTRMQSGERLKWSHDFVPVNRTIN